MKKLLDCIEYIKAKEIVEILIAVGVLVGFIILSSIFAKIIMKCFKIKSDKFTKKTKIYKISKFIWIISSVKYARDLHLKTGQVILSSVVDKKIHR